MGRKHLEYQHDRLVHRDLADQGDLVHPSIQEIQAYTYPLDLRDLNVEFSLSRHWVEGSYQVRQCNQEHQQHFYRGDRVHQALPWVLGDQYQYHHSKFLVDLLDLSDRQLPEDLVHLLVLVYRALVAVSWNELETDKLRTFL